MRALKPYDGNGVVFGTLEEKFLGRHGSFWQATATDGVTIGAYRSCSMAESEVWEDYIDGMPRHPVTGRRWQAHNDGAIGVVPISAGVRDL